MSELRDLLSLLTSFWALPFTVPDGDFELLLSITQESGQFFVWLIKADEQNLLHVRYLVTQNMFIVRLILCRERND